MDREHESRLLDFCARQQKRFDASAWLAEAPAPRERLSLVAFLLASARWYGHQDNLLEVARRLNPDVLVNTPRWVDRLDFDCSRFYHMLQARLEHEA